MRSCICVVVFLVLVFCSGLVAQARKIEKICAREIQTPPLIVDGKLDDACWKNAQWYSQFNVLNKSGVKASCDTRFALMCDEDYLYIGLRMQEPESEKIIAKEKKHDGRIYHDDCVQIFLNPDKKPEHYFWLSVNSLGVIKDCNRIVGAEWESGAKAKSSVEKDSWVLEIRIPLGSLELNKSSLDPWRFNIARVRRAGTQEEFSTFAVLRGSFHQLEDFVLLSIPQKVLEGHLWEFSAPADRKLWKVGDNVCLDLSVRIENQNRRFMFFYLQPEILDAAVMVRGTPERNGLDAGQARFIGISTPTAGLKKGIYSLSLYSIDNSEKLLTNYQRKININYTPLSIKLKKPCYKNTIFASRPVQNIQVSVSSDIPEKLLADCSMKAELRKGSKVLAGSGLTHKLQEKTEISIPASDLPCGDYMLRVSLMDRDGKVLHCADTTLRKVPPHHNEVCFDENMACFVNGKPFIVNGWFTGSSIMYKELAEDGYNTVGAYGPTCTCKNDAEKIKADLDLAHELGLKVILRPQPFLQILHTANKSLITKKEAEEIRQCVRKWKDHPALLAWYMADEPHGPLERYLQEYRIVNEEDPYHPCIMLNNTVESILKYHSAGDVLMPDVYPGFIMKGNASKISRPTEAMEACEEATSGTKPLWMTPQGQVQNAAGHRGPTYDELRNQLWQGVAHDAMGFFWYREVFIHELPASKIGVPYLAREVEAVAPAVRSKSIPGLISISPADAKLSYGVKKANGNIYIIAVSLNTKAVKIDFKLKGSKNKKLLVLSENRHINVENDSFSDSFRPYETHVYTSDLSISGLKTIPEIKELIKKAIDAKHKKGNLIYCTQKVNIKASPNADKGTIYLNDGCTNGLRWPKIRGEKFDKKNPTWIEINFSHPEQIGKIVVYSGLNTKNETLKSCEIEIPDGEKWHKIAEMKNNKNTRTELKFPPVKTQKLKIIFTGVNKRQLSINEIEAYKK